MGMQCEQLMGGLLKKHLGAGEFQGQQVKTHWCPGKTHSAKVGLSHARHAKLLGQANE